MEKTKGTYTYHPCIILNSHKRTNKDEPLLEVLIIQEFLKDAIKHTVKCNHNQENKCDIINNRTCLYNRLDEKSHNIYN